MNDAEKIEMAVLEGLLDVETARAAGLKDIACRLLRAGSLSRIGQPASPAETAAARASLAAFNETRLRLAGALGSSSTTSLDVLVRDVGDMLIALRRTFDLADTAGIEQISVKAKTTATAVATLGEAIATRDEELRQMAKERDDLRAAWAEIGEILAINGQPATAAGLRAFIDQVWMDEGERREFQKTIANLTAERDDAIKAASAANVEAQQTLSAALGVSPGHPLDRLIEDVADTMTALRRTLGCSDTAYIGQIAADVGLLRVKIRSLEREIASGKTLVSELQGHIERGRGREHALQEQIANLTPGLWVRLGAVAPEEGEIVLMWSREPSGGLWVQGWNDECCLNKDYFWRRLPVGLLDVPAPAVVPTSAQPEGAR